MFIEFLDQLRCTSDHEQSWLVATFFERDERFIVRGMLGCHICLREYSIRDGVAYFGEASASVDVVPRSGGSAGIGATPATPSPSPAEASTKADTANDSELALRAAAYLNVAERSTLVLAGTWAQHAHEMTTILPMRIFALNPGVKLPDSEMVATIESSEGVPLAENSIHGIALDERNATTVTITSALRTLRSNGRIVAPASLPVPAEVKELARDEQYWVGEKVGVVVPLQRARPA